jgi:hypothetical protein
MDHALADRAALVSAADRPVLPRDLAGTVAHAGVDPTSEGRALQDALRRASATRRGYCSWDVDHASWVVERLSQERQAWCPGQGVVRGSRPLAERLIDVLRPIQMLVAPALQGAPAACCGRRGNPAHCASPPAHRGAGRCAAGRASPGWRRTPRACRSAPLHSSARDSTPRPHSCCRRLRSCSDRGSGFGRSRYSRLDWSQNRPDRRLRSWPFRRRGYGRPRCSW